MSDGTCPTCHGTGKLPRTCGLCKWYFCELDEDTYYRYCTAPVPMVANSNKSAYCLVKFKTEKDRDASECPCYCDLIQI